MTATMQLTFAVMRWQIAQWFEKLWWKRYLHKQDKESYLKWKTTYWQSFLESVNVSPTGKVLDAGCGPAGIFTHLKECEVLAIDPLLNYYTEEIDHFNASEYPHVQFHQATLETLEFENRFDYVFCVNVINHVQDLGESLGRMIESCKTGGILVISTDCHKHNFWRRFLGRLPVDILHPHQYSKEEYANLITQSGAKIDDVKLLKRTFIFDYYAFICSKA